MRRLIMFISSLIVFSAFTAAAQEPETDTINTSAGNLKITFIGHASLMFSFGGKIIHIDPFSRMADYSKLPKADIILITHGHPDHLDLKALNLIRSEKSLLVLNENSGGLVKGGIIMNNGDVKTVNGLKIEAVPAYNIVNVRADGTPFHPKGLGNGYVITFGNKRVYVAGDTENIPEMKKLEGIDIAFLPMNLPYTMTPEMAAEAARAFKPKILYPYHYRNTDTSKIVDLLKDANEIEVRIPRMK